MADLKLTVLIAVCALALVSGCTAQKRQHCATYISGGLDTDIPRRVIVVPFDGRECSRAARMIATDAMSLELQGALLCDVIPAPVDDERLMAEIGLWKSGRVDPDSLIAAQKTYGADAFVFGTLTQYKPYDPPIMGIKVRMLSARTGDVLWACEAVFDAHAPDVRKAAKRAMKRAGPKRWLGTDDIVFMSPRYFSRFVASEIVRPLKERLHVGERTLVAEK